jgi:hypothetical protein
LYVIRTCERPEKGVLRFEPTLLASSSRDAHKIGREPATMVAQQSIKKDLD